MSRVTRRGTRAAALVAAATTAVLVAAAPAHAEATSKEGNKPRWQDSSQFTFASNTFKEGRRGRVTGNVTFVIHKDGNWQLDSHAHNKRIAWRNVSFTCVLKYGAQHREIEVGIARHRVDGKESADRHREGYEPQIQSDWAAISEYGQADCDMSLG
jgi:hypothetical protein